MLRRWVNGRAISGMNTPVAQWGARVKQQLNPEVAVQVGVHELIEICNAKAKVRAGVWIPTMLMV